jgi:hypothetical protein
MENLFVNIDDILALYDKEMRLEMGIHNGRREVLPELIRHIYDDPERNSFIVYNTLSDENADVVIEREIAHFRALDKRLELKAHRHDPLPDLHLRLGAHGFEIEAEPDYIMVLDLANPPTVLLERPSADVRQILDPAGLDDVMAVEEPVWNWRGSRRNRRGRMRWR